MGDLGTMEILLAGFPIKFPEICIVMIVDLCIWRFEKYNK